MTITLAQDDGLFIEDPINLKERLKSAVNYAASIKVDSEESFKIITSLYSESKDWEKKIEFARKQANGPDQDRINQRNDKARELLIPLKEIQGLTKRKAAEYQSFVENSKRIEEEKIKESVEILGLDEVPYIKPVETNHRGDGAIAYTRTVTKFRLTDLSKVPLKYLKIDEYQIDQDIKLGVIEIPGIEIYEEQQTTLRKR